MDFEHPTGFVRLLVDQLGAILELSIDLDDPAADGGEELGDGLGGLDLSEGLELFEVFE